MGRQRRSSDDFKAKVALEAVREQHTINELASEYRCPSQSDSGMEEAPLERAPADIQQPQGRRAEDARRRAGASLPTDWPAPIRAGLVEKSWRGPLSKSAGRSR